MGPQISQIDTEGEGSGLGWETNKKGGTMTFRPGRFQ